jgi:hypothetical protein
MKYIYTEKVTDMYRVHVFYDYGSFFGVNSSRDISFVEYTMENDGLVAHTTSPFFYKLPDVLDIREHGFGYSNVQSRLKIFENFLISISLQKLI